MSDSHIMPIYDRLPLRATRGEGIWIYDDQGQKYLDGSCGYGATNLGHCHPHVTQVLHDQADQLWHCSNALVIPAQEEFAKRLCDLSFGKSVFFCNSGVEAWEATIKIARKYFHDKGQPHKNRGITFEGCFHGRTIAAVSAAKRSYMVDGFAPLCDGFDQVPVYDLDALDKAITPNTAFINYETVMGEGGLTALDIDFLKELKKRADKHDLLLIADEVQCGFGRTGTLFAYEQTGVIPDLMSLAKGIGNGFPMGAYLAGEKCKDVLGAGSHGSTFGGNPMACAVGMAVLDVMTDPKFLPHVNAMGDYLARGLQRIVDEHPTMFEPVIRGRGLMRAVQLKEPYTNKQLGMACYDEKLLLLSASQNVLRIMPALIIDEAGIDEILDRLRSAVLAIS